MDNPRHTADATAASTPATSTAPAPSRYADRPSSAPGTAPDAATWAGVLAVEGEMTGDGRLIEHNALRWENLPLALGWAEHDNGAHDGAVVVGRILTIERKKDGSLHATGDFDLGSEAGVEAARKVREGLQAGVSLDLDYVDFEVRARADMLDGAPDPDPGPDDSDDQGRVTVARMGVDDEVIVTTSARIRAATLVRIPAFAGAMIELTDGSADADADAEDVGDAEDGGVEVSPGGNRDDDLAGTAFATNAPAALASPSPGTVTASAAPAAPPAEWFTPPDMAPGTGITVTDEGRVFGRVAEWGTCHTGFPDHCVQPPESHADYQFFHTGYIVCSDGTELPVGRLTMGTLHAHRSASALDTMAHYENTGAAVADVRAGEDEVGIWVAGALRPHVTDEQVRELRSSPLSGDWRAIGGNLELVAALAVNVPGFPIPRTGGMIAAGRQFSLVASGMITPGAPASDRPAGLHREGDVGLSEGDVRALRGIAARERARQAETLAGRARAVIARHLASRARARLDNRH